MRAVVAVVGMAACAQTQLPQTQTQTQTQTIDASTSTSAMQRTMGEISEVTPASLLDVLRTAIPVAEGDPMLAEWQYSPAGEGSFREGGQTWRVELFLGGLGRATDEHGRVRWFRFTPGP